MVRATIRLTDLATTGPIPTVTHGGTAMGATMEMEPWVATLEAIPEDTSEAALRAGRRVAILRAARAEAERLAMEEAA